jgi:hypothetical protein
MFERPQVNIVQQQSVESEREITGSEAEEILRRYGHNQQFSTRPQESKPVDNGLSFEQMVLQQEAKEREEMERKKNMMNGPRPTTFGGNNYDSEVRYGTEEDTGFGFRIEIVTDMKLPKY